MEPVGMNLISILFVSISSSMQNNLPADFVFRLLRSDSRNPQNGPVPPLSANNNNNTNSNNNNNMNNAGCRYLSTHVYLWFKKEAVMLS